MMKKPFCHAAWVLLLSAAPLVGGCAGDTEEGAGAPGEETSPNEQQDQADRADSSEDAVDGDEGPTGTTSQALTVSSIPFDYFNLNPSEVTQYVAPTKTGFFGWTTKEGTAPNTAVHDNYHDGRMATFLGLEYGSYYVPQSGPHALRFITKPIEIYASSRVEGHGWALSSNDATVALTLDLEAKCGSTVIWRGGSTFFRDATKSETRTKAFSKSVYFPSSTVPFYATAGQRVTFHARLWLETWTNSEGRVTVKIQRFGIPTSYPDNVVRVEH
jgi:hypothetical protein